MTMFSKIQVILLVTYFAVAASVSPEDLDHYNLVGFIFGTTNQAQHDRIVTILAQKTRRVAEEYEAIADDFAYLSRYKFTEKTGSAPELEEEFAKVWNDAHALEVLHGTFFDGPDKPVLSTTVFFGEYRGALRTPDFTIQVEITPKEFESLIDEHSITMLFALAMQAKKLKKPSFVIAGYLSRCRKTADRLGWLQNPDRAKFVAILDNELAALKTTSTK